MTRAWAQARAMSDGWTSVQRGFLWLGLAQLAVAGVHALLFLVLGGSLEGPVSIRKPILFSESLGLVSLSFAFLWNDLGLPRRWVASLGWCSIGISAMEVGGAVLQYWRGVPSHFNYATLFDGIVAGSMASGALIFTGFLGWLVALSWFTSLDAVPAERRSLVYGVRWAIPISLLGLGAVGVVMLLNEGQDWHGWRFLEQNVLGFRFGRYNGHPAGMAAGGSLMLVHAFGAHALQLLPLVGWLAGRHGAPESHWRPRVFAVAACYTLAILIATMHAVLVGAPVRDGGVMAVILLMALLALAAVVARALLGRATNAQAA